MRQNIQLFPKSTVLFVALAAAALAQACYHAPDDDATDNELAPSQNAAAGTAPVQPATPPVTPPPPSVVELSNVVWDGFSNPMDAVVDFDKHTVTIKSFPSGQFSGTSVTPAATMTKLPKPLFPGGDDSLTAPPSDDPGNPYLCQSYGSLADGVNNPDIPADARAQARKLLHSSDPVSVTADLVPFANGKDVIDHVTKAALPRVLENASIVNPLKLGTVSMHIIPSPGSIMQINAGEIPSINSDLQRLAIGTSWQTKGQLSGRLAERDLLCDLRYKMATIQVDVLGKAAGIGEYSALLTIDSLDDPQRP